MLVCRANSTLCRALGDVYGTMELFRRLALWQLQLDEHCSVSLDELAAELLERRGAPPRPSQSMQCPPRRQSPPGRRVIFTESGPRMWFPRFPLLNLVPCKTAETARHHSNSARC
jgi:hypothetical protein